MNPRLGSAGLVVPESLELLATYSAASATTGSLATFTIPARDVLTFYIAKVGNGVSSSGVALRFNSDSGTNYWQRTITSAAGGVVLAQLLSTSVTSCNVGGSQTFNQITVATVVNDATTTKVGVGLSQRASNAAATAQTIEFPGGFEWVNTTAQITTVELLTTNANNIGAGTKVFIFGSMI